LNIKKELERFLAEDYSHNDVTSEILSNKKITATIVSRQSGIVAGVNYAKQIFSIKNAKYKSSKTMAV